MTADAAKVLERARRKLEVGEPLLGAERDMAEAALDRYARSAPAPGARSLETRAADDQRERLLRQATEFFPRASRNEQSIGIAKALASIPSRARGELVCPKRYVGTIREVCWRLSQLGFGTMSRHTIYRVLSRQPAD